MTVRACLIVDDSKIVRKIARAMLEPLGFAVFEAEHGAQALEICGKTAMDLVLLDHHMPEMDGMEFLRRLRAMEGGGAPVVIFCTTETRVDFIQQAIACGANEFVMKPFDKDILEGKLREVGLLE